MTERDDLAEQGLPADELDDQGDGIDPETQAILDELGPADEPEAPAPKRAPTPRKPRMAPGRSRRKTSSSTSEKSSSSSSSRPTTRARPPAAGKVNIKAQMAQLYTMAGVGVSMSGQMRGAQPNPVTGVVVTAAIGESLVAQAEACGAAWEQLAKDNPRVRKALEQLLSVSAVGVLVAAHVPIVMAGVAATGGLGGGVAAVEQPAAPVEPIVTPPWSAASPFPQQYGG
jgi:hypothetical protein